MPYRGLREWLGEVERLGQLATVHGASTDLEIGAITALNARHPGRKSALLFDRIPEYPAGFRVLTSALNSVERLAFTCGMPADVTDMEFVRSWAARFKAIRPVAPRTVAGGPILENVEVGDAIDLWRFPTPRWNALDGGRYIGTAPLVITKDPETGQVNVGCYRVMIHDGQTLATMIGPSHHGSLHRQKWFARGEPCPVAISFGHDPLLFMFSGSTLPASPGEYDVAGGVKGEPIDVIAGPDTGLPIPAEAEIVVEGRWVPDETIPEGPFGEFTGYYAGGQRTEPALRVTRLMYRNDPIMLGAPRGRPPDDPTFWQTRMKASSIWDALVGAGVPDVQGVWCHHPNSNLFTVVSIKQRYGGHARQAGLIAQQVPAGGGMGKWTVVVDDDIDPSNIDDVLWAIATRADPERAIEITRYTMNTPLDSANPPGARMHASRCVIDACRPWEWREKFPVTADVPADYAGEIRKKWAALLWS